jgi:hypothetical protein
MAAKMRLAKPEREQVDWSKMMCAGFRPNVFDVARPGGV